MAKPHLAFYKQNSKANATPCTQIPLNHCGQKGSVISNLVQSCDACPGYLTPHSCQPTSQSQMSCLSSSCYVFESADFCDRRYQGTCITLRVIMGDWNHSSDLINTFNTKILILLKFYLKENLGIFTLIKYKYYH